MDHRPNFFQLLGLAPSVDDGPTIERAIQEQKAKWNKEAAQGHAAARRKAQLYQSMLGDIQSVMSNAQARRAEAADCERRIGRERAARGQELERWIEMLKADGSYTPEAVARIVKSLGGLFSEAEVLDAIRAAGVSSASDPASAGPLEKTDAITMASLRANLDLLGLPDLYAFLELTSTSSPQCLWARADEINRNLLLQGRTDNESNARKELAGVCLYLFNTPADKEKYDNALSDETMLRLREQIEWAGRDGFLSLDEQNVLVEQGSRLGVGPERARRFLVEYANKRRWKLQRAAKASVGEARREHCPNCAASHPIERTAAPAVKQMLQQAMASARQRVTAALTALERALGSRHGLRPARQAHSDAASPRDESEAPFLESTPPLRQRECVAAPTTLERSTRDERVPGVAAPRQQKRVYGIDLGTTYSCISYVDEQGKPVVVASSEGQKTTPSVVFFESSDNVVVGQPAKNVASLFEDRAVSTIKRSMGVAGVTRSFFGRSYTPPEISSFILRKLAKDAETATGVKVEDVVITCPAYFGIAEREATKQAGVIAGLNVLYVIPEPTAAAIAYGMEHDEEQTLLVFDLGGGTFDVTLIRIKTGAITVLSTGGDSQLGGRDWDDAIVTHLAQAFEAETGTPYQDLLSDPEGYQELLNDAEQAKIALSQAKSTPCRVVFGSGRVRVDLTRETFEQITAPYLQRAASLTREMIERAGELGVKIDQLLLVGGSTSMPQVREWAARLPFEVQQFDPDQAVAKGAALFGFRHAAGVHHDGQCQECMMRSTPARVKPAIRNVSSVSLGLVVTDSKKGERVSNFVVVDDPIPYEVSRIFNTVEDGQTELELRVMQNTLKTQVHETVDLKDCKEVLVIELAFAHPLPRSSSVEVTFRLDANGCLTVRGADLVTDREISTSVTISGAIKQEQVVAPRSRALAMVAS